MPAPAGESRDSEEAATDVGAAIVVAPTPTANTNGTPAIVAPNTAPNANPPFKTPTSTYRDLEIIARGA